MYSSSRSSYILSLLDVNNRNDHDPDDPLPLAAIIASTSTAAPVVDFDRNNSEEHDNSYVLTELSPVKLTNFHNSVSHDRDDVQDGIGLGIDQPNNLLSHKNSALKKP
ncbi:hypothetical protein JTB14_027202 [Gonioctena quinquepunctata]|nr:hypothetical protein JTB14_027202 [Gonioctena quinquepunctata]